MRKAVLLPLAWLAALALAGCLGGGGGNGSPTISPASTKATSAEAVTLTASGGSEPYTWSLRSNRSGATLDGSGSAISYRSGTTGNVTDEVEVIDANGSTARVEISVYPTLTTTPGNTKIAGMRSKTFSAAGGSGSGYTWTITTNRSGGSIVAATGVYTAGATTEVIDVLRVTDSLGLGRTVEVDVSLAPAPRNFPMLFTTGNTGQLKKLDAAGTVIAPDPFVASLGITTDVGSPAFDTAGNLYVPAFSAGKVIKVTSAGVVSDFVTDALLSNPQACAFDITRDLYCTAFSANRVVKISADGATVTAHITSGLNNPVGIAFDAKNNMYVANYNGNTVAAFRIDGTPITTWGSNGTVSVSSPAGLAFDDAGLLYATRFNAGGMSRIDRSGNATDFVANGSLTSPAGIALDTDGNLYVGQYNGTIRKVTPAGVISNFATGFTSVRVFTLSP